MLNIGDGGGGEMRRMGRGAGIGVRMKDLMEERGQMEIEKVRGQKMRIRW